MAAERYAFTVEWLDPSSKVTWQYQLLHTPADTGVEIYDPKNKKMFLKKTPMPQLKLEHLFVGASVVVLARTLKVTGYADAFTASRLAAGRCCPQPRGGAPGRAARQSGRVQHPPDAGLEHQRVWLRPV